MIVRARMATSVSIIPPVPDSISTEAPLSIKPILTHMLAIPTSANNTATLWSNRNS